MMKLRPVTAITDLNRRKIDGVEVNVIFTHKLVKLDFLGIKPPLLPLWGIISCNAWVADRRIKLRRLSNEKRGYKGH